MQKVFNLLRATLLFSLLSHAPNALKAAAVEDEKDNTSHAHKKSKKSWFSQKLDADYLLLSFFTLNPAVNQPASPANDADQKEEATPSFTLYKCFISTKVPFQTVASFFQKNELPTREKKLKLMITSTKEGEEIFKKFAVDFADLLTNFQKKNGDDPSKAGNLTFFDVLDGHLNDLNKQRTNDEDKIPSLSNQVFSKRNIRTKNLKTFQLLKQSAMTFFSGKEVYNFNPKLNTGTAENQPSDGKIGADALEALLKSDQEKRCLGDTLYFVCLLALVLPIPFLVYTQLNKKVEKKKKKEKKSKNSKKVNNKRKAASRSKSLRAT